MHPDLFSWFEIINHPWLHQPMILIGVLFLNRWLPLPRAYQPWIIIRLAAHAIANKVNKPHYPRQQLLLSGSLALLLLGVPFILLEVTFSTLSQWPLAWQAIVLYLCLDWQTQHQQALAIADSIDKKQLSLAKDQLQPLVLRDTKQLSAVGLSKAGIEALCFRFSSHYVAVLLWFMVGGAFVAFTCRLCLELQQCWNIKQAAFKDFGQPAWFISSVFQWPAQICTATLLALMVNWKMSRHYMKYAQDGYFHWPGRWLLACAAAALQRNLAGPVFYQGQKIQRVRIGPSQEPDHHAVRATLILCRQLQQVFLFFTLLYCVLIVTSQMGPLAFF